MVDLATCMTYAAVVLGLFLIPGPAVLLVLARSMSGGRRVGIATGLGVACGDLVHTVMATFGLSAVLMTSALAFNVGEIRRRRLPDPARPPRRLREGRRAASAPARRIEAPRAFRQAILAEVLNPEDRPVLPRVPAAVRQARPRLGHRQFSTSASSSSPMSAAYASLLALGAGHVSRWLGRHSAIGRWQGRAVGTIYIALGLRLALQER